MIRKIVDFALENRFLVLAMAGWFLGRWPAKRWAATVGAVLVVGAAALAYSSQRFATQPPAANPEARNSIMAWHPWSQVTVDRLVAAGRPVFVDFTASWCLSCQVNERVALERPEVKEAFAKHGVVLLKADWTRHDEAITKALTALNRSGVPAYAFYLPGESQPEMLPEALTPGIVLEALDKMPKR